MKNEIITTLTLKGWEVKYAESDIPVLSKGKISAGISDRAISYTTEGKEGEFNFWPMNRIKTGEFILPANCSAEHLLPELKEMRDVVLSFVCKND